MATQDISRFLFQPEKRYSGVRMQQGRVLLDSDWNESEHIDDEELRVSRLDIIGVRGTSNDGFLVSGVAPSIVSIPGSGPGDGDVATYDFELGAGSYYAGGFRFEAADGETFLEQSDWLRLEADAGNLPPRPQTAADLPETGGVRERYDLVYLRGWEQCVTPVEDAELVEAALGGPDTTTRVRRMRRVEVATDVGPGCAAAFDAVANPPDTDDEPARWDYDPDTGELVSRARLSVSFTGDGAADDPCRPAVPGGYLGAENETYRIQLTAPDRFVWGHDNAAPLYRVTVTQGAGGAVVVTFLTPPRDQVAQPLAGQVVEILPWSAELANGEKVAEQTGHLARVTRTYAPGEQTIEIDAPLPDAWPAWLSAWEAENDAPGAGFYYLRLWTGAPEGAGPDTAIVSGTDMPLGATGLAARFDGTGRAGDHWIVAARPHTPNTVVPWSITDEEPPAAPREVLAPLALVRWFEGDDGAVDSEVHDCRDRFEPLTRLRGCCTITVGDGTSSRGTVRSIQQAVDLLPPEGGRVCLLPGVYREQVVIRGKRNVTIEGCGRRSVITNPENLPGVTGHVAPALLEVAGSEKVRLRDFAVNTVGVVGIRLGLRPAPSRDVRVEGVAFRCGGAGPVRDPTAAPQSAFDGLHGHGVRVERCDIVVDDILTEHPALFARGVDVVIAGNRVRAVVDPRTDETDDDVSVERVVSRAWGGLQIAGPSLRVAVEDNDVAGGRGHGIILGNVILGGRPPGGGNTIHLPDQPLEVFDPSRRLPAGCCTVEDDDLCIDVDPFPPDVALPDPDRVPLPGGTLVDLRVADNRVRDHGGSGISAAAFWPITLTDVVGDDDDDGGPLFIGVEHARIENNAIDGNLRVRPDVGERVGAALGGIALGLAIDTEIRGNRITAHGVAGGVPVCGVGIVMAANVVIADNAIANNGRRGRPGGAPLALRGGIAVAFATRLLEAESALPGGGIGGTVAPPTFVDAALRVEGNRVTQPEGKALWVQYAWGAVTVDGNYLETRGDDLLVPITPGTTLGYGSTNLLAAATCVQIVDLGLARDLFDVSLEADLAGLVGAADGRILFHGNQTTIDAVHIGGAGAGVLLVSFDDVSVQDNQLLADLHGGAALTAPDTGGAVTGAGIAADTPERFLRTVADAAAAARFRSFLLYHLTAIGWTVRVATNRVTEGRTDAAGSILAVSLFDVGELPVPATVVHNQCTHCIYTIPEDRVIRDGNWVMLRPGGCAYDANATGTGWGVQPQRVPGRGTIFVGDGDFGVTRVRRS